MRLIANWQIANGRAAWDRDGMIKIKIKLKIKIMRRSRWIGISLRSTDAACYDAAVSKAAVASTAA